MKLKFHSPILDIAELFCTSAVTVHNIVITHIFALHEVGFEGMIDNKMPSLLKAKVIRSNKLIYFPSPREDAGGLSREYVLRIPSVS